MAAPTTAEIDVRLLGGVDVLVGGRAIALGGAKPRALLAALALHPGQVTSADRLVDDVWGERAPNSVRSSLHVHLSNVRKALSTAGVDGVIETRSGGYSFVADHSAVDVHRFGLGARTARAAFAAGDLEIALTSANAARAEWRGAPLAGIGDAPFAAGRVVALEADFLSLIELYVDIEIALGRPDDVVSELERVVAAHPYRETSWARLALALYRSGRQVDALDRLRTVRRLLAEDLGLEPSPEVAALELAILHQDPALRGDAVAAVSAQRSPVDDRVAIGETLPSESRLPAVRVLIGRDNLVSAIVDALSTARLVTVTGPGGAGKTSVAIAAAGRASASTGASARFVDLSTLDDADSLLPSVMASVGARIDDLSAAKDDLVATVNAYGEPILVFDNCEHVIDAVAPLVVDLLDRCPALRVLATSRAPLSVPDETVITCGPLSDEPAIDLFLTRAQSAARDYVATESERSAITALVERLDGLPLAIELFAARVVTLSAADMLTRFDDADVLATAWRSSTNERHRSLHDVVSWSYALLDDEAQRCLRRLSVFGGSASAAAIAAVCEPVRMATVDQLVTSSLVVAERTSTGVRYRLLATVRAFASAELEHDPDRDEVRMRLVGWATSWAQGLAGGFASPDPSGAMDEFEANVANIRVAHEIALSLGPGATTAARLLAAFGPWALTLTPALPEAVALARAALADPGIDAADRMVLLILVARLTNIGTNERKAWLREAIAIAESLTDDATLAAAWAGYSLAATDVAIESLAAAERGIELGVRARQPVSLGWSLGIAATALVRLRRFDDATDLLDRHCLSGTRRFGAQEPFLLFLRGRVAMLLGDLDRASEEFMAAEQACQRTRSFAGLSTAWYGQAEVDRLSGRIDAAYARYRRCLPLDLILEPGETGLVRMMIVWTACLVGELDVAEHHAGVLAHELALEHAVNEEPTMIEAVSVCADGLLALAKGLDAIARDRLRAAIRLWAASDSWDVVSDLLERLTEVTADENSRATLHAAALGVRAGTVSLDRAVAIADTAD